MLVVHACTLLCTSLCEYFIHVDFICFSCVTPTFSFEWNKELLDLIWLDNKDLNCLQQLSAGMWDTTYFKVYINSAEGTCSSVFQELKLPNLYLNSLQTLIKTCKRLKNKTNKNASINHETRPWHKICAQFQGDPFFRQQTVNLRTNLWGNS